MKKRPWPIVILALLHILAAPGNIILNAFISDVSISQKLQEYLAPEYRNMAIFYILAPIVAGVCIYICKKWSFWVYVLTLFLISLSSYYGYTTKSGSVSISLLVAVLIVDIFIVSYFFLPAVRAVYFDPRLRWWESSPRYKVSSPATWNTSDINYSAEISNFSLGGLFLKSETYPKDDEKVHILFEYDGVDYDFIGNAIIHSQQNSMGFGVKFNQNSHTAKVASELVKKLDSKGLLIRDRLADSNDSLKNWSKQVLTTGKGLIPDVKNKKT